MNTMRPSEIIGDYTAAEQRIFAVLADPENMGKLDLVLMKLARVSNDSWYRITASPAFAVKLRRANKSMLGDISAALKALKESASNPDPKSAPDRRTLFQMTGHLPDPRLDIKDTGAVTVNVNLMPLCQMLWCYLQVNFPKERWMPAVRDQYEAGVLHPEMPPLPTISNPFGDQEEPKAPEKPDL